MNLAVFQSAFTSQLKCKFHEIVTSHKTLFCFLSRHHGRRNAGTPQTLKTVHTLGISTPTPPPLQGPQQTRVLGPEPGVIRNSSVPHPCILASPPRPATPCTSSCRVLLTGLPVAFLGASSRPRPAMQHASRCLVVLPSSTACAQGCESTLRPPDHTHGWPSREEIVKTVTPGF